MTQKIDWKSFAKVDQIEGGSWTLVLGTNEQKKRDSPLIIRLGFFAYFFIYRLIIIDT